MKTDSGLAPNAPPGQPLWRRIIGLPSTRLGWWSVGLAVLFIVMMLLNGAFFMQLPEDAPLPQLLLILYGIAMLLCGLAAGIVALVALTRRQERSGLVCLPLLAGLFVIMLLLGEFLVPH